MAEAVVSLLIEHFGSMAINRIEEEIKLVTGVKVDVQSLKTTLTYVQAVLQDAEMKQLGDDSVKVWLQELKNASYDMDNVLDEWNTAILKYNDKQEEKKALEKNDSSSSSVKKVCFPISFSGCFSSHKVKVDRLMMRRDIAIKIKQLNEDLCRISENKKNYGFITNTVVERLKPTPTTSLVNETEVHGRDEERSLLVSKLLCESSADDKSSSLYIIPIVGMGGLGKTTLAKLAYNDKDVKSCFDKRIWVCVSVSFDEVKIAKTISEGLGKSTESSELNVIVNSIHESIEGKRVLIVLDDVWLEDGDRWESIREAIRNAGRGSRVLVTTRKREVAMMMGAATNQICPEKLSDEQCWSIFRQFAFKDKTAEKRAQLESIGRQVAAKSGGLPLVAKILGGLLYSKENESDWKDILLSQLWKSDNPKIRKIFAPFLLSYYELPLLERRCLLYCSVFPQDYDIKRDDLVAMWMSQGYLGQYEDPWKRGLDCFESLAMRSFFQDFNYDYDDGVIQCKMHDIVHDFTHFLTGDEFMLMDIGKDREKNKAVVKENPRHLTVLVSSPEAHYPDSLGYANGLRTLLLVESFHEVQGEILLFSQLTCLRTLIFHSCRSDDLSKDIGILKHLRYLDISDNDKFQNLPEELCELYNLETLNLRGCLYLEILPESISKLVNLQHLYLRDTPRLDGLPKGMGKLRGLRTLDKIVVPYEQQSYLTLEDLNSLKHLEFRGLLEISKCGNAGTTSNDAAKLNLNGNPHLVYLSLNFGDDYRKKVPDKLDTEILESINPHPNLKILYLRNYAGRTASAAWMMSLSSVTRLELHWFQKCETLPSLGKLPSLEFLEVRGFSSIEMVGEEFLGVTEADREVISFPKLEVLQFSSNSEWRRWDGCCTKNISIMPRLRTLTIDYCEELETLPEFLQMTPLQNLTISSSPNLSKQCKKEIGKEWHKISHVPNIRLRD